jgi:hypothetical protein
LGLNEVEEKDIIKALLSNYYSILYNTALPPCQVKVQETINNVNVVTTLEQIIKKGVLNGSIPSIVTDSAATSSVGTPTATPLIPTGRISNKIFQLPDGTRAAAGTVSELVHNVWKPAKDVHIVPSIESNSLLSTAKFAEAGYITFFDNEEVNIYDAHDTKLIVSRGAILQGWFEKRTTCGESHSSPSSSTTTQTRCSPTNHPPISYLIACQSLRPSTMSTNSNATGIR